MPENTSSDTQKLTASQADPKRYLWLMAMVWGLVPLAFMYGAHLMDEGHVIWGYFVFIFGVVPLTDHFLGEDSYNPPESEYVRMRDDQYYKWVARATTLVPYVAQVAGAWYLATHTTQWFAYLGFAMAVGWVMGLSINAAHEVGHKSNKTDLLFAHLGLIPSFMGHFRIEHNFGHHIEVATPQDTATARMGQSYYDFVLTELPGGFRRAWGLEAKRLAKKGKSAFSLWNEVFTSALLSIAYYVIMVTIFGVAVLPFLLIASIQGNLILSSANYIEHYGLLRQKLPNGKYERCQPHHSWNSNRFLSNLLILHLERHSDHHAFAQRPYQCLRHFDDVPQLPAGYTPMFMLSWIPPLWYKVMDKRVAEWADYDMNKVMIKKGREEEMFEKWHNPSPAE